MCNDGVDLRPRLCSKVAKGSLTIISFDVFIFSWGSIIFVVRKMYINIHINTSRLLNEVVDRSSR